MHKAARFNLVLFSLAALLGTVWIVAGGSRAVAQTTPYRPGTTPVAQDLPVEITLNARVPFYGVAGLFGRKCNYDSVRNELYFFAEDSRAGIRILPLRQDASFQVDFSIRNEQGGAKFETRVNDRPAQIVLAKGIQHVLLQGRATKDAGATASVRCLPSTEWTLLSVRIRRVG